MTKYRCEKCKRGYDIVRKSNKRHGDILEMAETITHEDGTKERRVLGRVNEKTNEILEAKFI